VVIWYIFPVLVCFTNKNLATMAPSSVWFVLLQDLWISVGYFFSLLAEAVRFLCRNVTPFFPSVDSQSQIKQGFFATLDRF
jgi:hypothetical protein